MSPALLDTDLLSEILKGKDRQVVKKASAYLADQKQFALSAITYYEVIRGLKAKQASRQLQNFRIFCEHALVLPITEAILDQAADLWVVADQQGHSKNDADLIIAATAIADGRVLATANTAHFAWIAGLTLENWRQP
jgi:tRNA(fMet)-specific endonuclease VapC